MDIYKINTASELIQGNTYPGRGIIAGLTPEGKNAVTAYFIMGRSANSRNRIFVKKGDELFTEPCDISKVEDPSLIIYAAVRQYEDKLIVTNGDQTDTIYDGLLNGETFSAALTKREFEPDAPNFTPRISALLNLGEKYSYSMNILKSADAAGSDCSRFTFDYPALPGLGHFIHTYVCDGNPIPTFQGEPERIKMDNDINAFSDAIWNSLDPENKISLYVRYINLETKQYTDKLTNKYM